MRSQDRTALRFQLSGFSEAEPNVKLYERCMKVIDQYGELANVLIEIENATLVVNDGERLRREVRELAADAIKEYVLK